MEDSVCLLDTPEKKSLQSQADSIRADLKDFERSFSANHDGRKPGQAEIRDNADIAAKYKQYRKIREVLTGKLNVAALVAKSPKKRKSSSKQGATDASPSKRRKAEYTPTTRRIRPDDVDPYDAPSFVTPRRILTAIGPTPQRDGQVLGIFDLLSNPPTRRSDGTPAKQKQKAEQLVGVEEEDSQKENTLILQTPSRKPPKPSGDILDHLTGTPETNRLKHSRTPISNGKKFMLSHFFATPSAVRYADLLGKNTPEQPQVLVTPLRNHVLGPTPPKTSPVQQEAEATPAYLKRSHSFKDRLLSASQSSATHSRNPSLDLTCTSPVTKRTRPRTMTRAKFMPKPLSQIAAEMRKREDEKHADDEEAMREMEEEESRGMVCDSQERTQEENDVDGEVMNRVWKKKGQKRQTRRAVLRPNRLDDKPAPRKAREAPHHHGDEEDEGESSDDLVEDTQPCDQPRVEEISDDELHALMGSDYEDEASEKPSSDHNDVTTNTFKPIQDRPLGKAAKPKPKAKSSDAQTEKRGKINPNALSHMNFRSLKIKNKNSKGKGRGGRFGRGRR